MLLMAGAAILKAVPSIIFQSQKMEWGAPSFPRESRATSQITFYLPQQQRNCSRSSNERQPRILLTLKGNAANLTSAHVSCRPPKTVLSVTFSASCPWPDKLRKDEFVPISLHFINTQDEVHASKQWAILGSRRNVSLSRSEAE